MTTSIRAALAALALVPALVFAPAALAQDADCYPVPPEGCESSTDGGSTDGGTTDGEQPTSVLPTIIDRPDDTSPQPAPAPPAVEAAELPRTGTDAGDLAILALVALGGGAAAIGLSRRETEAVEIDR